ncbi:MAG TPA: glycoside hydrolase family 3 N-terminal domain-containing protein [Ktedonobacteraceae bacterium]|nr:glycoside hydrolase family 3 N-terminal domain-containing protein [Ktedonobacteraceae bacterium]
MQTKRTISRRSGPSHAFLLLCSFIVLLVGCGATGEASGNSAAASTVAIASPTVPTATAPVVDLSATVAAQQQQKDQAKVQQLMHNMTLDEKLGQMIMVEYIGTQYADTELPAMITQDHVGGFLFQQANGNFNAPINTVASANAFISQAQKDANVPLLVAVDQEGGLVNKLSEFAGPQPSAAALAATNDPNAAFNQGAKTAQLMKSLGINVNLAPVVDVGPQTNLLESRQFSDNPQTVTTYAGAFLNGLQQGGIAGCLKHFPGLGSLPAGDDPHQEVPRVTSSLSQLQNNDLFPYTHLIQQNNPAMIMTTDVFTNALDPNNPAELSQKVVTDTLRKQMGFNGVIITDGIYMLERANYMPMVQAATQAIIAGNDIVEGPYRAQDVASLITSLNQAIQNGQLSTQQVDQSVQRILAMKVQYGMIQA